ncbi:hypothetical protein WDW37_12245 [Bdellovibrionota bacterium FG-1]
MICKRYHLNLLCASLATFAIALLCSCSDDPIDIHPLETTLSNAANGMTWHAPHAMDLGDLLDSTNLSQFYAANSLSPLVKTQSTTITANLDPVKQSFGDFHLAGSTQSAVLISSLFDGSHFRAAQRLYSPYTFGGTGWAQPATAGGYLDDNPSLDYLNLAASFSPGNTLLTIFNSSRTSLGSADLGQNTLSSMGTWSDLSHALSSALVDKPIGSQPLYGATSSIAWDPLGHAYYGFIDTSNNAHIQRYTGSSWYLPGGVATDDITAVLGTSVSQIQLLNDGLGVTALWVPDTTTNPSLQSAWSLDNDSGTTNGFSTTNILSSGLIRSMAAAADDQGNVVSVFIQQYPSLALPPVDTITTTPPTRYYDYRVYGSARGASGLWIGPTQLDDPSKFDIYTTTHYQDSLGVKGNVEAVGGIEWYSPAIAYVGSGRFMAAFAITDLVALKSSIVVRGYTVGTGWDPIDQIVELDSLSMNSVTEAYRYANDLKLVGDGQGNATLIAHVVVPSGTGSTHTLRNYGFKAYPYSYSDSGKTGSWGSGQLLANSICRASTAQFTLPIAISATTGAERYFCWALKAEAVMFAGGETVIVYPAPAAGSGTLSTYLRLYSTELRK